MKREKVYLVSDNNNNYRYNEPAEIIGIKWITPYKSEPRLCYHLRWIDGVEDLRPISDSDIFKISTCEEIIPKVIKNQERHYRIAYSNIPGVKALKIVNT